MPSASERHAIQQRLRGSINHRMPPFPCVVLFYSKDPTIKNFRVVRFGDQQSFDKSRVMSVAMVRVVLHADDLKDVPTSTLVHIFNTLSANRGESIEVDAGVEILKNELQDLVFGVLADAATPYEDTQMGTATTPETGTATPAATTPADASTKAEAKAKEAAAKKAQKEKEKNDRKVAAAAKRADGVIGTIRQALDTETGTTANEVLDTLVQKFPDRTREGMSSTVKIQFSRLEKSTGRDIINSKIKNRGRVYKFADKGAVPGELDVETPAPVAAVPAAAPAAVNETPAASAPAPVATPPAAPAAAPVAVPPKGKGGVKK